LTQSSAAARAHALLNGSSRKGKGEGKTKTALGNDKAELERRRGAIADAWPRTSRNGDGRRIEQQAEAM